MFDYHVLDMIELGVEKYIPMDEHPVSTSSNKPSVTAKKFEYFPQIQ